MFWVLLAACVALGWVGGHRPDDVFHGVPVILVGRIGTTYYFFQFLILMPLLSPFERPLPLAQSISKPVLENGRDVRGRYPGARPTYGP
jgi:ubiquinol-cytochrome c reductase cytochrome b subunit